MSTLKDESEKPVAETGLAEETEAGGDWANQEAVPATATGKQHDLEAAADEGGAPKGLDATLKDLGYVGQQHFSQTAEAVEGDVETNVETEQQDHDEIPYPEPEAEEKVLHPPDFKPFFTLVESSETGEHNHPTVHYVFADDDPDVLTNAALESLRDQQEDVSGERFVILDLSADGKNVQSATSLSPEWQALKTQITAAPSWGGGDGKDVNKGLMLRISGQEAKQDAKAKGKRRKDDVEGLLKAFDEQITGLDGVLGSDAAIDTHPAPREGVHEIDSV